MFDATGCVNDCLCTVIRPEDVAAIACIWLNTQLVAAPMPRFGSVWLDAVCRVPNETSFSTVALIRSGSTSRSIARRPGSGAWRLSAGSVSARAVPLSRGAATAVTAEADRNARRVEPARPGTSLFSIPQIMAVTRQMSTRSRLLPTAGAGRRGARGRRGRRARSANESRNYPHIRTYIGVTVRNVLLVKSHGLLTPGGPGGRRVG